MAPRSGSRASAALLVLALVACPARARPHPTSTPSSSGRPTGTITIAYPWEPPSLAAGDPSTPAKDLRVLLDQGFVLRAWHKGLDMVFDAPSNASVAAIRVVFVPDPTSALKLLNDGAVDALGPYQAPGWSRRTEGFSNGNALWSTDMKLNPRGPLADARVRNAFVASIDRLRIGRGLVGADGAPAGETGSSFDLASAKRSLDAAGWRGSKIRHRAGKRLQVTLALVENDDLTAVVARAIQFQALRTGFDVELVPLRADMFWGKWLGGSLMNAALVTGPVTNGISMYQARASLTYRSDLRCLSTYSNNSTFTGAAAWSAGRCT